VVAQVSVLVGIGEWMPLAAPALWAISAGAAVTSAQLLLIVPFVALAVLLTATSWRWLQLDR
jgi:ABC-2 type transport system permease protein